MPWEEKETQIRHRVREPEEFREGSFATQQFGDGVSAIIGTLKSSGERVIQALRFQRDKFSMAQAKAWAQKHSSEFAEPEDEYTIEVFRAGGVDPDTGKPITQEQCEEACANYRPDYREAPLCVGHPSLDAPAYGWAKQFTMDGPVMKAHLTRVSDGLKQAVRDGHYRKVSVALWRNHFVPWLDRAIYYPKHIGLLGAAAPAIPDLKPVAFKFEQDDTTIVLERPLLNNDEREVKAMSGDELKETPGWFKEHAEKIAAWFKRSDDTFASFSTENKALREQVSALTEAQKKTELDSQKKLQEQEAVNFAKDQIKGKKIVPAQEKTFLEMAPALFSLGDQGKALIVAHAGTLAVLPDELSRNTTPSTNASGDGSGGSALFAEAWEKGGKKRYALLIAAHEKKGKSKEEAERIVRFGFEQGLTEPEAREFLS